jgi:SAM-dependent methyltransferase
MADGWSESAEAWIADMGDVGDFGRACVLDRPMLARVAAGRFTAALDVGCGEGRFCRMLGAKGIATTGIDPTEALISQARYRHPKGDYRIGRAESLDFADASFDLVVSYLSLIDIPDIAAAIAEMARVLRPGGSLLIANLTSFNTAGQAEGWTRDWKGHARFSIDHYLEEHADWVTWRGIRIRNWHRPLESYMALLLEQGLILRHFAEPSPYGGEPEMIARYRRVPWFLIMEWQKPG